MKVAIVTPQSVPLSLGGAENLWFGLQENINLSAGHSCDVISVMAPENNFWDLIDSYETFSKLDLSGYDCIITGKYPAWMVSHPNHICYMLHRLRGLYDTYTELEEEALARSPNLRSMAEWISSGIRDPDPDLIPELFERLRALKEKDGSAGSIAFPGPFSRAVIHFLDNAALSPGRIRRYAAISQTVAKRRGYFPPDAIVDVLYPPPHLEGYYSRSRDYFLVCSRLDAPKRIDLIINAMKLVEEDVELLICGIGPEETRLRNLAGEDDRIKFLGFVPDKDLVTLYSKAKAVIFTPSDEDYGLVTIEAMKSSKPVLTTTDSGGPCEFVRDGETGFVCPPTMEALASKISALAQDDELAQKLGEAGYARVKNIGWNQVTRCLLQPSQKPRGAKKVVRQKLTVASTFPVYPPLNGGQSRVYFLYRSLASHYDIDIVSLSPNGNSRSEEEIAPGVIEIVIPKTLEHLKAELSISRQVCDKAIGDITANALLGLTPAFGDALELSAMTSMAVIASHPYTVDVVKQRAKTVPLWYDAHNVEILLKSKLLEGIASAEPLLQEVRMAEQYCWRAAERVFACTTQDLQDLRALYGPTTARLSEVPNGVDLPTVTYRDIVARKQIKAATQISAPIAMFMGSWHQPNIEAVEAIIAIALAFPTMRFLIVGSVGLPFQKRNLPNNVELTGVVDAFTRDKLLGIADVALNPMYSGSGSNLKMLDYMAAGVPVISTVFGARGLPAQPGIHYVRAGSRGLEDAMRSFLAMSDGTLEHMVARARSDIAQNFDWDAIAERLQREIKVESAKAPWNRPPE